MDIDQQLRERGLPLTPMYQRAQEQRNQYFADRRFRLNAARHQRQAAAPRRRQRSAKPRPRSQPGVGVVLLPRRAFSPARSARGRPYDGQPRRHDL